MDAYAWTYRFAEIEVDPAAHRVTRQGIALDLEPKAFAVLVALLEHAGKALSRDDLLDSVWGHRHVTPGVLNRVIGHLRKALGDDAENPRFIQTLHGVGYRFLAEVERIPAGGGHTTPLAASPNPATVAGPPPVAQTAALSAAAGGRRATDNPTVSSEVPARASTKSRRRIASFSLLLIFALGVLMAGLVMTLDWRSDSQSARPPASIAVLPFTNLGGADNDYFVAGLTEEMRSALAGVVGLKVAASITTEVRRNSPDAKALGAKLGVATILEASVRREGNQLRINARLSDTRTGFTLWSESFDRRLLDVFDTQSRIANEVVQALLGVIPGEGLALRKRLTPTRNVDAYDEYLQGMNLLSLAAASEPTDQAIDRFHKALEKDSGFALAQAGICAAEARRFESLHSVDAFQNARVACQRALNMDASLAEVHLALGDLYFAQGQLDKALTEYQGIEHAPSTMTFASVGIAKVYAARKDARQAEMYFAKALAASPADPLVYAEIGYQHYIDNELDLAIGAYAKAVQLAPDNVDLWTTLGGLQMEVGDNASAAKSLERSVAIDPGYAALTNLGLLQYQAGDFEAAVASQRRALEVNPTDFMAWANLGMALNARPETRAEAHEAYAQAAARAQAYLEKKPDDARSIAALGLYRAILGEPSKARELLAKAEALGAQIGEVALLNAETLALLGDSDAARLRVERARREGIAETLIASNPVFRRLNLVEDVSTKSQAK